MVTAGESTPRRPRRGQGRSVRQHILDATSELLAERSFNEFSVADILTRANVARGTFYFHFGSKHEVLAELVRRTVARGHEAAHPSLGHEAEGQRRNTIRYGVAESARLWREHPHILRAIVENWRSDPGLAELWLEQMSTFTATTEARLEADAAAGVLRDDIPDTKALATALTWLGERLHYLAAIDVAPLNDEEQLVDVLTHIWMSTLYARD
ncbi:TetR/AcrR family transcriptional regulator [Nocardia aurea]|uniref:TetR/AcrR family transcriptional regulator n=1 Tax=Nocardia aurea TaxID=2144174 RepID=UPI0033A34D79